jgi:hypothetical protein
MMDEDGAGGGNPVNASTRAAAAEKNRLLAAEKIKVAFKAAIAVSTGSAMTTGAATPSPQAPLSQDNVPTLPPHLRVAQHSRSPMRDPPMALLPSPPPRGVTMRL